MESAGAACKIPSGASVALKPNLVVAPVSGEAATTRLGLRATEAPEGILHAAPADSIRARVMAWALVPKIS